MNVLVYEEKVFQHRGAGKAFVEVKLWLVMYAVCNRKIPVWLCFYPLLLFSYGI